MEKRLKKVNRITPDLHLKKVVCNIYKVGIVEGVIFVYKETKSYALYSYYFIQDAVDGSIPPAIPYKSNAKKREKYMKRNYGYRFCMYIGSVGINSHGSLTSSTLGVHLKEMYLLNFSLNRTKIIEIWD